MACGGRPMEQRTLGKPPPPQPHLRLLLRRQSYRNFIAAVGLMFCDYALAAVVLGSGLNPPDNHLCERARVKGG